MIINFSKDREKEIFEGDVPRLNWIKTRLCNPSLHLSSHFYQFSLPSIPKPELFVAKENTMQLLSGEVQIVKKNR
jgi:hypothetical protein